MNWSPRWSLWVLLVVLPVVGASAARDLYVAPDGKATNPGTSAQPLATLGQALAVACQPGAVARILVQPGSYCLTETLTLGPEASGLTIEGVAGKAPVIVSGGRRVLGWKPWRGRILQADLSQLGLPDLDFHELYYNGKLMPWARTPNFDPAHPRTGGFLQAAGIGEKDTKTKLVYAAGDLHPEKWAHPERAWMMFHDSLSYETQYCPLKSVDPANRVLEASRGVYVLAKGNPFYVCGVLEELDAPGEWCVDPDTKTLYFWPPVAGKMAAIDPNREQIVVPALKSAFVLKGDPANGKLVENVRLAGLDVRDCRGRAIELTGAKGCVVARCDLRNAEVGVYLGDDTHGCQVRGCDITQTQGDGVSIIGSSKDHERVTDNVVDNCYIWDIGWGRIHNRCGGVYGHRMMRTKITHNHIHDTPRYAIGMDVGGDCEIAYNDCHHSNLVTLDTSIIEAATALDWGLPMEEQQARHKPWNWGNSVHHNVMHDSGGWGTDALGKLSGPRFSWGVYLDTHCSGWHVYDNLIYNTVLGAFMVNGGMDNVFENNVCLNGKEYQCFLETWPKFPMSGNVVQHNVFAYAGRSAALYNNPRTTRENLVYRENLVWAADGKLRVNSVPGATRKDSWEKWLALGQDQGTVVADPQFVSPKAPDWRLKPTSPALRVGFQPFDLSNVGNYASPDRRTWPRPEVKVARDAFDYTPSENAAAKQTALRDYEDYAVGESERNAHVGNKGEGTALVTDETAAGGKHSLKFTDAAGLGQNFFPYITYPLEQDTGSLKMSFDLRWEKGGMMALDWRDDPYQYNMGPNLTTTAEGMLKANGKDLLQLPVGQWVHIEINCLLGDRATGKYDLTVKLPNAAPQIFKDTACSPKFSTLNCVVFMAVADAPGVFYIDNLAFVPGK